MQRNSCRWGTASVNQEYNGSSQRAQAQSNIRNAFYDENMNLVSTTSVQQVNDRAFYQRNGRWIDSQIVEQDASAAPAKVLEFGSREHLDLAYRLASEGRQGCMALKGEILMQVDGQTVLVK